MSREITSHVTNPANSNLQVSVLDQPGAGGACHHYKIHGFDSRTNASDPFRHGLGITSMEILFQNGPIPEQGVNGITHEALLAVLIDRLEGFQAGKFACEENQMALECVRTAMYWLHCRTQKRMERGVEGTHKI